jgi:uncharacterized membrane protein YfcA
MTDELLTHAWLALAALAAGAVNSVAGGGTLLTFPSLLGVMGPVEANATSTVALMPGSAAAAWGLRRELRAVRKWLAVLVVPSLIGGAVGTLLVTRLPQRVFDQLVPWLILTAAVLFALQKRIARWLGIGHHDDIPPANRTVVGVVGFQFLVGVYGGYFGAGIGILMLTSLSLMGLGDIHRMNALKTILAACMNGMSVIVFALEGAVRWPYAASMSIAAMVGGYLGAHYSRRLPANVIRWVVIVIGFTLAAYYFWKPPGQRPAEEAATVLVAPPSPGLSSAG